MTDNINSPQNGRGQGQLSGLPSTSTFSFKAPFPVSAAGVSALKHRRVSLASPSSPRLVQPYNFRDEMGLHPHASTSGPEKKGKMRKIDLSLPADDEPTPILEKKPRKKWSEEETQMLVRGCQLHDVGNWKTILQDPNLKFHDRSAVDLKDRFRTYFPDAYKKHYPNARTHLSNKIRSTLSDGTSLFEKTRSKRRRPFTEAEDRALKAGYEKHGTTWATIVKDPIFQEQERRSTDLRDRFRNAFPDLYQAAGYKPRTAAKKKLDGPLRAVDDSIGPVRSRRTKLRGGTKSVPQSAAVSEDDESSAFEEDESEPSGIPVFVDNVSTAPHRPKKTRNSPRGAFCMNSDNTPNTNIDDDDEMQLVSEENTDALQIPDFHPNHAHADMDTWSTGLSTPTHSSIAAWSTAGASPTSSHVDTPADFMMGANHSHHHHHGHGHSHSLSASASASAASSPFMHRRNAESVSGGGGNFMIGKSAWGEDWLSSNPRLDARSSSASSHNSDTGGVNASGSGRYSPPSPWSFNHAHLHGDVLDRYGLFPPYMPDAPGSASETGLGEPFGNELGAFGIGGGGGFGSGGFSSGLGMGGGGAGPSAGGTGFKGYHSQIAGDLISGASSNAGGRFASGSSTSVFGTGSTSFSSAGSALSMSLSSLSGMYSSSFGDSPSGAFDHGSGGVSGGGLEGGMNGLGLEGMPQSAGIHPMQLHSHTPSLLAIDELGLTGIDLNDRDGSGDASNGNGNINNHKHNHNQTEDKDAAMAMETVEERSGRLGHGGHNHGISSFGLPRSPVKQHVRTPKGKLKDEPSDHNGDGSVGGGGGGDAFGLEDLVDMAELHATPPATPLMTQPRPMRRASENIFGLGHGFDGMGFGGMGGMGASGNVNTSSQHQARSISVPPSEARNGGQHGAAPTSMDDVSLHMHHGHVNYGFFSSLQQQQLQHQHDQQTQTQQQQQQHGQQQHYPHHRNSSPMRISISMSSSSIHSPISPIPQQVQHNHNNTSQLTPIFPSHLVLSPSSSVGLSSPPSSSSGHPNSSPHPLSGHNNNEELWRTAFGANHLGSGSGIANIDYSYNLPFLDLHYYYGNGAGMSSTSHGYTHSHPQNSLGLDVLDEHAELSSSARQGQAALDLAQSAALASMGGLGSSSLGLGLPLRAFDSPSPVGTIRHTMNMNGHGHGHQRDKPNLAEVFTNPANGGGGGQSSSAPMLNDGHGRDPGVGRNGGVGMGTIRQSHGKGGNAGPGSIGRSMSHHRGQSAVCPQDLMLRNDNKRKRASWDGGVV